MLLTFYYEHTLCERDFTCALSGFQIFFQEKFVKEFQESLPTDLKNLEKVLEGNESGKGYFVGKKVCTLGIHFSTNPKTCSVILSFIHI